jgi:hypothetical protein
MVEKLGLICYLLMPAEGKNPVGNACNISKKHLNLLSAERFQRRMRVSFVTLLKTSRNSVIGSLLQVLR